MNARHNLFENSERSGLREYVPWPAEIAARYRELGCWQDKSLLQLLNNSVDRFPENVALIDGERNVSYSQLQKSALELAAGLVDLGLQPGDKVILQLPNCAEFFEIFFALVAIRVVPVLALPAHRQREIKHFADITGAKAYIVADKIDGFDYRNLARALQDNTALSHVVVVGEADEFISYEEVFRPQRNLDTAHGEELALLQLSGGTTNIPKLIPRTHNDYAYSIRQSIEVCGWDSSICYLAALPIGHNFTLSSPGALGVLASGGTLVLASSGAPDVAFDLVQKHGVTWTALVPPLVNTWLQTSEEKRRKLRSLQVVQVGGATFSSLLARRLLSVLNCQLQQVFGMAEGLVNYTRLDDQEESIVCTQGRPMSPHDEVLVVDDDDQPVERGVVGHLLTRGPYTIRGYYRAEKHNAETFTPDGFYRTGDLVSVTEDGHLSVQGRSKDQINRGGEKISVPEIEDCLLQISGVSEVALIPVADEYLGERACAVLTLQESNIALRLPDVRRFMKALGVADYKIPDFVFTLPSLPKTAFGKINRNILRKEIESTLFSSS